MSVMNNIFSRTRKREVTTDLSLATRKPHPRIIKLTDDEQSEYDNVIEEYYEQNSWEDFKGDKNLFQGAALGLIQKKRQIASSPRPSFTHMRRHDVESCVPEIGEGWLCT
jgi:hypothetical protein